MANVLDRIKNKVEEIKAEEKLKAEKLEEARQAEQVNEIKEIANYLEKINYFNKVWKSYRFEVSENYYKSIADTWFQLDLEVKDEAFEAGFNITIESTDDGNDIQFVYIPYDYSPLFMEELEYDEPLNAYTKIYESAFNRTGDEANYQVGDYDKLLTIIEEVTNKKLAKQVKNKIDSILVENYEAISKIIISNKN